MTTPAKECRIAESKESLANYLQAIQTISKYELSKINLEDQKAWSILDGVLSHSSKGFFQVVGLKNIENTKEERLMLYQPQSALTGLVIYPFEGKLFVLLQARVEPGNTGVIQYGPTIQSTPANYLKLHGGKATAYVHLFTQYSPECQLITHSMQHDLGSKYFQKSKTHHYLIAKDWIETEENMIWASLGAISELMEENNFLNADLRSLLSVMDWEMYFKPEPKKIPSESFSPPTTFLTDQPYELVSLSNLTQWKVNSEGILPLENQPTSVHLFHFSCTNREVAAWSQPLFEVNSTGTIQLFLRKTDNDFEFLVTLGKEAGISTPFAIYPSKMSLPEENHPSIPKTPGQVIRQLIQCDEGGRFYQNDNLYQLILVEDLKAEPNQQWISRIQLKNLLQASNTCSFQLRCASSLALDILNPKIFE